MSENKNYEARAAAAPTALHEAFAHWLFVQTGVKVDVKSVQLACSMRMDFQSSPENQANLAERKAKAAAAKKASASRKKAKLEAELLKLAGKAEEKSPEQVEYNKANAPVVEEVEAPKAPIDPVKLTVVYGDGDPEVHKFGCADTKKMTRAKGFTKETANVSSHTALTELIYADQIEGGEATTSECYMSYDAKPCVPALDS